MSEAEQREEAVFEAALQLPAGQRAAYLDKKCSGDVGLRRRVEVLLGAFERAGGFLKQPAVAAPARTARLPLPSTEKPGDRIGRYKLLQQIGEGGCGVVYMAEQEEPVRRRVALKVIKLGMDTKQVIARFEAERQALALMDHPNIAKVLDAGATDTGRPYFVMELVRGLKITDYCDQNNLCTEERLKLFTQVCQAIQHAHQKGIIHRDIKPSNVLVTVAEPGAPGCPKVIDFGIAKATHGKLTDQTLFTAFEQFIGTPAYMSPEQAEMSALDIDTRSDIYSLGVLLYELLTGQTPFNVETLLQAGLDEIRRTIREQEPARPSTRLSTMLGADLTAIAKHRNAEPLKLIHLIRGDLDWIVMKALEKNRTRRYETANGLAVDIQRHLNNEPVVARPPSNFYRFQKLVQRNKLVFTAASAVIAALIIGLCVSIWSFHKEEQAREQAQVDRRRAETEAARSRQVAGFLQDMLTGVDPSVALGHDTTVLREILDKTAERMSKDLKDQPEVEADLRTTIAHVYFALGQFDKAEMMLRAALKIRRKLFGNEHPLVATSLYDLSDALLRQDSQPEKNPEAELLLREALAMQRKLQGSESQDVARSVNNLAFLLVHEGKLAEAEILFREALSTRRKLKLLANGHSDVAWSLEGLCEVLIDEGRPAEAEPLAREALMIRENVFGKVHPDVASSLYYIARVLNTQGKTAEAEPFYREALAMRRKLLGSEHPDAIATAFGLADLLKAENKPAEIEALYREILAGQRASLGNNNPAVAGTLMNLADAFQAQGKQAEAEEALLQSVSILLKLDKQDFGRLPSILTRAAQAMRTQGKSEGAEKLYADAITFVRLKLGGTNTVLGQLHRDYGVFLREGGKSIEALDEYQKALLIRRAIPNDDPAQVLRDIGYALVRSGKFEEAEGYLKEALAHYRKQYHHEDFWGTAWAAEQLAVALYGQNKLPEAEAAYRDALAAYAECQALSSDNYAGAVQSLLNVLKNENKLAEAEAVYREAAEHGGASELNELAWSLATSGDANLRDGTNAVALAEKAVAATNRKNSGYLDTLAAAYAETGQFTNAVRVQQEAIALLQNEQEKKDGAFRLKLYENNSPYRDHNLLAERTLALLNQGKFAEAEPLARDCLALREKAIPDSWRTFNARSLLGGALLGQKKYAEAEPLLLSGYEGLKQRQDKIPPEGKVRVSQALQRLVQLYEATDRPEQTAEWKRKLAEAKVILEGQTNTAAEKKSEPR